MLWWLQQQIIFYRYLIGYVAIVLGVITKNEFNAGIHLFRDIDGCGALSLSLFQLLILLFVFTFVVKINLDAFVVDAVIIDDVAVDDVLN